MIVSFPSHDVFTSQGSFAQETINLNAPEETFARAYRRFSCRGRSRVAKTRWKAAENTATVPPVASVVGAVYRVVIRERERDTRWLWLLRCSRARPGKIYSAGNQRRSEPAPVNEPRRFFNGHRHRKSGSILPLLWEQGERKDPLRAFPPLSIISDPFGGKIWAENYAQMSVRA